MHTVCGIYMSDYYYRTRSFYEPWCCKSPCGGGSAGNVKHLEHECRTLHYKLNQHPNSNETFEHKSIWIYHFSFDWISSEGFIYHNWYEQWFPTIFLRLEQLCQVNWTLIIILKCAFKLLAVTRATLIMILPSRSGIATFFSFVVEKCNGPSM